MDRAKEELYNKFYQEGRQWRQKGGHCLLFFKGKTEIVR